MKKPEVIHELVNDDWARLYLDGKVFAEGHEISHWEWQELCKKLGADVLHREVKEEW